MKGFLKLVLLLCSFAASNGYAQKQGKALIDSLQLELPKAQEDTKKVNILNKISFNYNYIDPDKGLEYGQLSMALAEKLQWKKGIAWANNELGINYESKSDYSKSLDYFFKALNLDKENGDKKGMAIAYMNIGNVYEDKSDYPGALEFEFKALSMFKEMGDKDRVADIFLNLGNIYEGQSDYANALEYEIAALKIYEGLNDKEGEAFVLANVGSIYNARKEYAKALEYDFRALKMRNDLGNKLDLAKANIDIGFVYDAQNKFPEALEYYFAALQIAEKISDPDIIAQACVKIARVKKKQGDYLQSLEYDFNALKIETRIGRKQAVVLYQIGDIYLQLASENPRKLPVKKGEGFPIPQGKTALLHEAINYLKSGLDAAQTIKAQEVMLNSYGDLAKAYQLSGNYQQAAVNYQEYIVIKDTFISQDAEKRMLRTTIEYEYDKKYLADSLNNAQKDKINRLRLQKQKSYTYMGIAGILLLSGFSFFILKERGKSERLRKIAESERKKSDELLLNILPEEVATELKANGGTKARYFDNVTVLFTDFVNFTEVGGRKSPQELIDELHACFKVFDEITAKYNIEKIKTIGDAYLAVCGLPLANPKHAENIVGAAIEISSFMKDRLAKEGESTFEIRIGINSGSVVAGIVGVKKFAYDIWGDTVNTAARMEQNSEAGRINISQTTYELVKDKFICEYRGEIEAKGKGVMKMYYVV